ncbi:excinuclease ABC subunit C [Sphingomonas sp. Leaf357]|uniref:GIY-YIG nuclease family protein n=1 Tax=Sphingomonas sp. Leaf357 TaxID=1736350 RepID=UPI0006FC635C|nr:GIY-YIG nuclease family protein [Sphingomonas sp. Leaf357]KQS03907.1 excinuclease ABC subunit C [Sphingomonas sp. Leaf357]
MARAYVYIIANRRNGALYIGVTNGIARRMAEHRARKGSAFCIKYGIDKLIYVEASETIADAIAREKALKGWNRAWKIALIQRGNPDWRDLFFEIDG